MLNRRKWGSWGSRILGLAASVLIFWAPLQSTGHHLAVVHTWCEVHGHLVELQPAGPGAGVLEAPTRQGSLTGAANERGETSCSSITHERRPAAQPGLDLAQLPSAPTRIASWSEPDLAVRCLESAPKQGPPTRS